MGFWDNFKKKQDLYSDFSIIGTDMHSHLIPGIDDGSRSMEDSLILIRGLQAMGYRKIITTPHIMIDHYPNDQEIILSGLKSLRETLKNEGVDVEIEAASEYYFDDHFIDLVAKKELLTFGDNYVLFEFPMPQVPMGWEQAIYNLILSGYKPILAHPERYLYWSDSIEQYRELVNRGVKLQLNIMSLEGYYGKRVKKLAERLVKEDLVCFLGTDLHHQGQLKVLQSAPSNPLISHLISARKLVNGSL